MEPLADESPASSRTGPPVEDIDAQPLPSKDRVVIAVGLVVAAVPLVRMANSVRLGTHTQYVDYWHIIDRSFRTDGWLDIAGVFTLRNEHPVAVANVVYWLNARVLDGSNITLGRIVLLMAAVQVVLLGSLLGSHLTTVSRAALVVAFSALLFAPQGSWSFLQGMSGTAWLSANLLAVGAIFLRSRDRRLPAIALGGLASISYATGLLVWPALLATGLARDRKPRAEWPVVVAAVIAFTWYIDRYRQHIGAIEALDSGKEVPLPATGTLVGSIFAPGEGHLTRNLGWALLVAAIVVAAMALRADSRRAAPWTGVFTFAIGSVGLVAAGRNNFLADLGASRYSSLAALLCVSVLGHAVLLLRWTVLHVALCLVVVVAASAAGGEVVDDLRSGKPEQELLAIALRLDLAEGTVRWEGFGARFPPVTSRLADIGHYPFSDRFTADCGLLGERLPDPASGPEAPQLLGNGVGQLAPLKLLGGVPGAVQILGRLQGPARCVLVTDSSREVIGMGLIGYQRQLGMRSPSDVFTAIAPAGRDDYQVYAVPSR